MRALSGKAHHRRWPEVDLIQIKLSSQRRLESHGSVNMFEEPVGIFFH
jgi:hypothetical protein